MKYLLEIAFKANFFAAQHGIVLSNDTINCIAPSFT
jgi:hypothetical protein